MYEVEEAKNGMFFVSKNGWGRSFKTLEAAQEHADFMNDLESNPRPNFFLRAIAAAVATW